MIHFGHTPFHCSILGTFPTGYTSNYGYCRPKRNCAFRMNPAHCIVLTVQCAAFLRRPIHQSIKGLTVQTILEILLVNTKTGTAKKSGQPYSISEAHCVLRDETGAAGAVGVLTIPKSLEEIAKPGVYTASFALEAPTYGENQGKVVAALKGLSPVPPGMFKRGSEPSAQAPRAS